MGTKYRNYNDEEFKEAVRTSKGIAEVLRKIGLSPKGGNYKTFHNKIKNLNLDTSHFVGAAWNQGDRYRPVVKAKPLSEILVKNSSYANTHRLKLRLISEGIREAKCELCDLTSWLGSPLSLQLHHKDGVRNNNLLSNLQILCPNCHSQTDNFAGRNISK